MNFLHRLFGPPQTLEQLKETRKLLTEELNVWSSRLAKDYKYMTRFEIDEVAKKRRGLLRELHVVENRINEKNNPAAT
jgi:hypothetical protein